MLLGGPAHAAPTATVDARVSADLRTIEGSIHLDDAGEIELIDVLGRLPMPGDDLQERRTFPGRDERGSLEIIEAGADTWRFQARIPRRYGASGRVPGRGLFMNGLWYPQPVDGGEAPVIDWIVSVQGPEADTLVLNDAVGSGAVRWQGRAERLSLAVLRHAQVRAHDGLTIVDGGHPNLRRDRRIQAALAWPGERPPHLVVVEAPLRRRLTRPGPGVLFLSDRAFRVTDGLWRYHLAAVHRGLLRAGLPIEDPWLRDVAAAGDPSPGGRDPSALLGWFSWIPQVDQLLYDGQLPFFSDTFDEAWPADPVRDDLQEILRPLTPGAVVAGRLDALHGQGAAARVSEALIAGHRAPAEITAWRDESPRVELGLHVQEDDDDWVVEVQRQAPADSPGEPVIISVDGERQRWSPEGEDTRWTTRRQERPRSVRVDPDHLVRETDRADDAWPTPWTAVTSFFPYELNLHQGRPTLLADLWLRRRYGSRWLYGASLSTDPEDLVSGGLTALKMFGPLRDRRNRPFAAWFGASGSLLDPAFRPLRGGQVALGLAAGGSWETRVDPVFPRRGHRVSASGSLGLVPGGDRWGRVSGSVVELLPIGGRLVFASRASAGLATGGVQHRLLSLGGTGRVQAIAPDAVVGDRRLIGATELRWRAVRYASVPLPLAWLSDVQLSTGLEAGRVRAEGRPVDAVGGTVGVAINSDLLGARPTLLGLWAARPLWTPALDEGTQLYLRMLQAW